MRKTAMRWTLALLIPLLAATAAHAQEDEAVKPNPKIEGYEQKVRVEEASTTFTWVLLIFLGVICVGVMFKNAKRTHLD